MDIKLTRNQRTGRASASQLLIVDWNMASLDEEEPRGLQYRQDEARVGQNDWRRLQIFVDRITRFSDSNESVPSDGRDV